MHPLDLKLLRDVGKMKGQMIAVGLVMACGLAMMIMTRSLILSLTSTRDAYYSEYGFGEVFADLKRAPNSVRSRLADISGVAAVKTRVTGSLTLLLPGLDEPADGTILSIPEDRPMTLNRIFLRSGRLPEIGSHNEVVAGEAFARMNGFRPGDEIEVILRGAKERLKIVGIGLSPEYVFEARPGETLPDNHRFGVFWMNERDLATALDLDGAFNNVVVDVAPGASTPAVMSAVDRVLEPYGGRIAYDRRDHPSDTRLRDELNVLAALAVAFPIIFLSIAAFMTSAVIARIIRLQREQIAQLKAFGYSSRDVGIHYLKFAMVIVLIGSITGGVAGIWLGTNLVTMYHKFFKFPLLEFQISYPAVAAAFFISAGASLLGVIGAVRQAVKLPPAEAMRPEPPAEFKPSAIERLGVQHLVSPSMRMAFRNLERRPWSAAFTALGLALATAIPVVPGAMRDAIHYLMGFQWDLAERQSATLSLIEPTSASAMGEIRHLPGVIRAEPIRATPAELRFGHRSRRLSITGVAPDATLNRALDKDGHPLPIPSDGLLVSAKLAELLGAKTGDSLRVEVQEGRRPRRDVVIRGLITDYAGLAAYMDIDALRKMMQEGATISGAYVSVDGLEWKRFLEKVKKIPRIANLGIKEAVRQSFRETTAESINLLQSIYFLFAVIVAFGVVYNSARISISERGRDLATLRVVGFTNREVAGVMIGELAILTLVALPVGLLIGGLLSRTVIDAANTESIRLPLILSSESYSTAVLIVLISALTSFAVVARQIRNLDLLGVLKASE